MLVGSVLNGKRNAISANLEEECRTRQITGETEKDRMDKSGLRKGEVKETGKGQVIWRGRDEEGGNEKCSLSVKDEERERHIQNGKNKKKRRGEEKRGRSNKRSVIWKMEKDGRRV